uniref:Proteasome assembly chaperone 4 n=1 Tax=Cyanistes caeruleus TaxID=156563 RepID=A0A8C0U6Z6_CYACU
MQCCLHITISISYTCLSHSIIYHVFLQCQVSCPGAGVSVLLCITVHTFSFCFLCSLVGVLATTAASHVLALSPSLFLIFIPLLRTHVLHSYSSFYIYLSVSACMMCRDCFPPPCLIALAQDVSHYKTKKQIFVSYNLQNTDSNFTLLIENRIKEEMTAFPEKF